MAAEYPGSIYSPRTKQNKTGVVYDASKSTIVYVEDTTKLDDEVVAIETELGTDPKGDFADVKTRLDDERAWKIIDKGVLVGANNNLFDKDSIDTDFDIYKLTLRIVRSNNPLTVGMRFNNIVAAKYDSRITERGVSAAFAGLTSLRINNTARSDTAEMVVEITFMRGIDGNSLPAVWKYTIYDQGGVFEAVGGGALDEPGGTISRVAIIGIGGSFGTDSGWLLEGQELN